jgi:hypothetical protein
VIVLSIAIYALVRPDPVTWPEYFKPAAKHFLRTVHGVVWGASAALFLAVATGAILVLASAAAGPLRGRGPAERMRVYAAAALPLLLVTLTPGSPFGVFEPYITTTLAMSRLPEMMWVVSTLRIAATMSAWLVLAAACAALLEGSAAASLAGRRRTLHVALFAGAAVFSCAAIEIEALLRWAISLTTFDASQAKALTAAATFPSAALFSLFLAAVYVPAALVLDHRARALGASELESDALASTTPAKLVPLLAVLAPLLAALAAAIS